MNRRRLIGTFGPERANNVIELAGALARHDGAAIARLAPRPFLPPAPPPKAVP